MNEETVALLPCPFCGGEQNTIRHLGGWFFVECTNEDCDIGGPGKRTEAEAITAWNTRAAAMGWRDIASALTTWCREQSSLHHRLAHEGKDDDELCSQHIALSSAYLTVADKIATLPTPPEPTT